MSVESIDHVVVSTDDNEIAEIAKQAGAQVPFMRPASLSNDKATGISVVLHALEQLPEVTDVLVLQPTSSLRTSSDIESILSLRHEAGCNSAVSLTSVVKHPSWMYSLTNTQTLKPFLGPKSAHGLQELPSTYILNGSLYLATRSFVFRNMSFISNETVGYVMPPERSVDIDTMLDWQLAELLMSARLP